MSARKPDSRPERQRKPGAIKPFANIWPADRGQRRQRGREEKAKERELEQLPLRELVSISPNCEVFEHRVELLWQEVAFRALKRGESDDRAGETANAAVGVTWRERRDKARSGALDDIADFVDTEAVANAIRLQDIARARLE